MPVSKAVTSQHDLLATALSKLAARGYTWNRNTTRLTQHLATALSGIRGTPASHLEQGMPELLAGLANTIAGGSPAYSHKTSSVLDLLVVIANSE